MDSVYICIVMGLIGLCFGSFAGAQVWRLRARQLVEDKAAGEPYNKKQYKILLPLTKRSVKSDRSQCLSCGHPLRWYDLLPLASWVSTGGKCRYCRHPIGRFEPLIEISTAIFFVASFLFWPIALTTPLAIVQFAIWLLAGVMLVILFAYDAKWFLLPDKIVFPLMAIALAFNILSHVGEPNILVSALSTGGAVMILSGLYFILWFISQGRWIGFGDVKLGIVLGLLVGTWQLALLTLFLANLIGTLIVLPGLVTKKLSRTTQVPFGPMLIVACVTVILFGEFIIDWYSSLIL